MLIGFVFYQCCFKKKMGPKKVERNVRKTKVPTDTPTEFELGDTAADIQRRREKREQGEKEAEKQQRKEREGEEARRVKNSQPHTEEGVAKTRPRTERSDSEMDIQAGGEVGPSQL